MFQRIIDECVGIYVAIASIPIIWKLSAGRYFVFRDASDFVVNWWSDLEPDDEDDQEIKDGIKQAIYERNLRLRRNV